MLNLRSVFQDSIDVFSRYPSYLKTSALPASIFLMQQDVVNHYRHAVTHYLPLTLNEHFLQNSSIGTPYEKWAKFTNMDFNELSFTVTNLIRYTIRLIKETETTALQKEWRFAEASVRCDSYIYPLSDINHCNVKIGLRVAADQCLFITPFSKEKNYYNVVGFKEKIDGNTLDYLALVDANGQKHIITKDEYRDLHLTLREQKFHLKDRSIIKKIAKDGVEECDELEKLTEIFHRLCKSYYKDNVVVSRYDGLFQCLYLPE